MIPPFLPDRLSPFAGVFSLILPFALRRGYGISGVRLEPGAAEGLAASVAGGAVLTCNHPTDGDPPALWWLLRRRRVDARYMAGWDVLARQSALLRGVLASGGVFSVRRDGLDRPALRRALHHLEEGRTVVVFPEGRTHGLGTRLLPFLPGAAQVALWAAKKGSHAPPLVPLAVFYRARGRRDAFSALAAVEAALDMAPAGSPYERVRAVSLGVLAAAERAEGIAPGEGLDLDARIRRFYRESLALLEAAVGLAPDPSLSPTTRIFALRLALDERPPSTARRHLSHRVLRLHRFTTAADGHIAARPTPERVLDLMALLGWELAHQAGGRPAPPPPREAVFGVSPPLPTGAAKDAQELTSRLEGATAALLDRMESDLSQPMEGFL